MNLITRNVDMLFNFMQEREHIRLRRLVGAQWPWTKDPILQTYKFTNVQRLYDRTTQGFLRIYAAHAKRSTFGVTLQHCAAFRYTGTLAFAEEYGWRHKWNAQYYGRTVRAVQKSGRAAFTGAYMITNNGKTGNKETVVGGILSVLWLRRAKIEQAWRESGTWRAVYDELHKLDGFGGTGFMAKEVLQDMLLTRHMSSATDKLTWTPAGPGARRGLCRICGEQVAKNMPEEHATELILAIHAQLAPRWELFCAEARRLYAYDSAPPLPLSAHDIQFQLCEFDKYERARSGEGRPKNLYRQQEAV